MSDIEENGPHESAALLATPKRDEVFQPPKHFVWMEVALYMNVFLSGLDGTITASTYALIGGEFNALNTISWITTSYLLTSTAWQPLYGRFSDILGRRACFFIASASFGIGCLGCGFSQSMPVLVFMRALSGVGGGGLMTMATIVNSDVIPLKHRGMYQAVQNLLHGFGSIIGASAGGIITEAIGWRWCFLMQVPVSALSIILGYMIIPNQLSFTTVGMKQRIRNVDMIGSLLLVTGLTLLITGCSLGGNIVAWSDIKVVLSLTFGVLIIACFLYHEKVTDTVPVLPLWLLQGRLALCTTIANIGVGLAAYAFLFTLPLYFQVVLSDTASKAGERLVIPSFATPAGGLLAGFIMTRFGFLSPIVKTGALLMTLGNFLAAQLGRTPQGWQLIAYLLPANLGQGMAYPGILFTFLTAFDHEEHAVSTSMVYLCRSMGTVWGVAGSSAIIQNFLKPGLESALRGVPNSEEIIEIATHEATEIRNFEPHIRSLVVAVYDKAIKLTFAASSGVSMISFIASLIATA